ncbi:MAG: glycosyltransferase family 2 protein [Syntrophaceae bacterium]|nr:glycosyltransferase family 2 protein [Syntrophaceae bacterium]
MQTNGVDGLTYSVIIITRNRASVLRNALESVINQEYENGKYEMIVVDNNSNDDTASIVETYQQKCPNRIRYVIEPEIGMSKARNTGSKLARGEILVFIDDDAIASAGWLRNYQLLYQSSPDIVAAGGRIEVVFTPKRPKWISDELLVVFGRLDSSDTEGTMLYPRHPFGVNFSVRKEYFLKTKGFFQEIKNYNDEKAFFYQLHLNKCKVGYSPEAVVYHHIPSSKLRRRYFIKRGIKQGIGNIKFISIFDRIGMPRFDSKLKQLLVSGVLIIRNILFCRRRYSFSQIYYFSICLGELLGIMMRGFISYEYRSYSNTNETP